MSLIYDKNIDNTKIAIWHIAEEKNFFIQKVPLQREITHPHKQLQHLAGRYLLQYLYPDFPYDLIEIADTRKPFLQNEQYHFSISHCGNYAAVIVSKDHRVGIDIELITPKVEKVKHKFLNEDELKAITKHSINQQINKLTLLWCCKEAVFKWYGSEGVDFKEDIYIQSKEINNKEGIIECIFKKDKNISLPVQYKFFDELWLAWIAQKI